MRNKIKISLSLLFATTYLFALGQSSNIKEVVSRRVVQVFSGGNSATGFIWKHPQWVVTTLHAIGNPDNIEIRYHGGGTQRAVVKKIFKSADLVLLQTNSNISEELFNNISAVVPPVDTKVFTIGYYKNDEGFRDIDFTVGLLESSDGSGGNFLRDELDYRQQQEITKLGFLSNSTKIIPLKGNLLHGFSGSPIVDHQGYLVGIADGGLENGAASISWCISNKYLSSLESSSEPFPLDITKLSLLFSASRETDLGINVSTNNFNFKKIKTTSFDKLDMTAQYSSTENLGLKQVLNYFSTFNIQYNDIEFDIYIEEKTGYTILVPKNYHLTADENDLIAEDYTNRFKLIYHLESSNNIQQSFFEYEQSIMPNYNNGQGPVWLADPVFSYPYPILSKHAKVQRLAYVNNNAQIQYIQTISDNKIYFTATSARGPLFVPETSRSEWAAFVIAAQLATFSN